MRIYRLRKMFYEMQEVYVVGGDIYNSKQMRHPK
jgi:hypothetical protein